MSQSASITSTRVIVRQRPCSYNMYSQCGTFHMKRVTYVTVHLYTLARQPDRSRSSCFCCAPLDAVCRANRSTRFLQQPSRGLHCDLLRALHTHRRQGRMRQLSFARSTNATRHRSARKSTNKASVILFWGLFGSAVAI